MGFLEGFGEFSAETIGMIPIVARDRREGFVRLVRKLIYDLGSVYIVLCGQSVET